MLFLILVIFIIYIVILFSIQCAEQSSKGIFELNKSRLQPFLLDPMNFEEEPSQRNPKPMARTAEMNSEIDMKVTSLLSDVYRVGADEVKVNSLIGVRKLF